VCAEFVNGVWGVVGPERMVLGVDALEAREGGDDGVDDGVGVGFGFGVGSNLEDLGALIAVEEVVAREGTLGLVRGLGLRYVVFRGFDAVAIGIDGFREWYFGDVG